MPERRLLSVEHGHPAKWMSVPEEVFEDDLAGYAKYKRRELAVIKYANGESYSNIQKATKICKQEVIRFVKLCTTESQGVIPRFFALIPYRRAKAYERHEPSTGGGKEQVGRANVERGFAGCCIKFFEDHPEIREHVEARLSGELKSSMPEARVSYYDLWDEVLKLAKKAGVSNAEWPFRLISRGRTGFYRYFAKFVEENPRETDESRHGQAVASKRRHDPTQPRLLPELRELSCLQLDYAKVDGASIFDIERADGSTDFVPVRRWYWGMLYCPKLKAVVGFHVSLSRNPSADDAIDILESVAFGVNEGGLLTELENGEDGSIILNGFFPQLKGHGMSIIRVDNGWANKAKDTLRTVQRVYGCALNLGQVKRWMERIEIERKFGSITRRGPATLASTYGVDPTDSRRSNPEKQAQINHIRLADVVRILAEAVRDSNVLNTAGLYGTSPIKEAKRLLTDEASGIFPMPLPRVAYPEWVRFAKVEAAVVRAGDRHRVLPYIEKWGATYTCKTLFETDRWIGKSLIMFINRRNANQAFAVSADTKEHIGELCVTGRYANTLHTISERKQVEADIRDGHTQNLELEGATEIPVATGTGSARKPRTKTTTKQGRATTRTTETTSRKPSDIALDAAKAEQNSRMNDVRTQTEPKPEPTQASSRPNRTDVPTARVIPLPKPKTSEVIHPEPRKVNRFGLR